jgi:hypothetical protein
MFDVDPLSLPLIFLLISNGINLQEETKFVLQQGSYEFKSYIYCEKIQIYEVK